MSRRLTTEDLIDLDAAPQTAGPALKLKELFFDAWGYEPMPKQWEAHSWQGTSLMLCGGERGSKSKTIAMEGAVVAQAGGKVAVCAQAYDQTKKEMEYIIEALESVDAIKRKRMPGVGKWEVWTKTGGYVLTVSMKDGPGELTATGEAFDAVILCEAGRIAYDCFIAAWGRIAETGGRVILGGTLWDNFGWYADFYEVFENPNNIFGGKKVEVASWENFHVFLGGKDDPKIKAWRATMTPEEAARRIDAKLMPSPARIYPEFSYERHVKPVGIAPEVPIEISIDPGYQPGYYAIGLFQDRPDALGREGVCMVGEKYLQNMTHAEVINLCMAESWWDQVVEVQGGHECAQHAMGGIAPMETWKEMTGLPFRLCERHGVVDGINRVKTFLIDPLSGEPRFVSDVGNVNNHREFKTYKRRTDRDGRVMSEEPDKHPSNHDHTMDLIRNHVVLKFGAADPGAWEDEIEWDDSPRDTPMG